MKLEFSQHIFEKSTNIKLHEHLCSGRPVVPCWRMDMMKLTFAFCNFARAS